MDDWIRVGAQLLREPEILAMAKVLAARARAERRRVPPPEQLLATCVGAVIILWITFLPLADENDVIPGKVPDIEKLTGIQGFCDLLSAEWLVVLDAEHIKLPGFRAHRSTMSLKREQDAIRAQRYRNRKKSRASITDLRDERDVLA